MAKQNSCLHNKVGFQSVCDVATNKITSSFLKSLRSDIGYFNLSIVTRVFMSRRYLPNSFT